MIDLYLAFFKLIRWTNLLIIVFTQYLARIFLVNDSQNWLADIQDKNQALLSLSTITIAAAGYIINDYFDVKIDLVNKPNQVIIGKVIRRRWAMFIHQCLNIIGVLIGLMVSYKVLIVNVLAITVLWLYAERYKKKPFIGNFLVATLTASSLIIMAVYYTGNDLLINIYAVFAFGISLIREIIKDIEDIEGDKKFGCRTLPIVWGILKTKKILFVFIFLFVTIVFFIGLQLGNQRVMYIFLLLGVPFVYLVYRLYFADRKADFAFLSSFCKWIMIVGICSMVFI